MMNVHSTGTKMAFALAVSAVTAGISAAVVACSGGSSKGTQTSNTADAGTTPTVEAGGTSTQPGSCPNPTIPIVFSPMYSAFIPGSTAQTFAIPAVTTDGNTATWSLSDPTQGNLQGQSFVTNGVSLSGVVITVEGIGNDAGQVTVVATESDGTCGASVLTLTQNTEDDWNIGNARYNDGVALHLTRPEGGTFTRPDGGFEGGNAGVLDGGDGGGLDDGGNAAPIPAFDGSFEGGFTRGTGPGTGDAGSFYETDGGTACTNCHGPTATTGPYKMVSHSPEQTGGFSDTDLQNIIWNGEIPDGGYFDPTVLISNCDGGAACTAQALADWHSFHRWTDITADELPGVICYLRAIAPESQNGSSNFGGAGARRGDGGAGRPAADGGAVVRVDAGTGSPASGSADGAADDGPDGANP
jgi:hypothetical protein